MRLAVNVATEQYRRGQIRLVRALCDLHVPVMSFGEVPKPSPSHSEIPFAFKAHALKIASKSADVLLWLDASMVPIKPLDPIWDIIEAKGYWIPDNGFSNYEWTADSAYPDLFPDLSIEDAQTINRSIPHVVAGAFGISLKHYVGRKFLDEFLRLAQTNAFCGPAGNSRSPRHPNYSEDMLGDCGPEDVLGHRWDQTAISVISWRLGMELDRSRMFSYPPGTDETILLADGGFTFAAQV